MHPLDTAFPQPVAFELADGTIVVAKELTLGGLARALAIAAPLLSHAETVETLANDGASYSDLAAAVEALMAAAPGAMLDLMALLTDATRERLEALPAAEGLLLAALVVQLNASFFASRVLPAIAGALAKVAAAKTANLAPDGGTQSLSS